MLQSIRALYAKLNEHRNEINSTYLTLLSASIWCALVCAITTIIDHLLSRARDADEKVRKAAVTAICEIAAEYSDAIPVAAINEVELRVRDKKVRAPQARAI